MSSSTALMYVLSGNTVTIHLYSKIRLKPYNRYYYMKNWQCTIAGRSKMKNLISPCIFSELQGGNCCVCKLLNLAVA